MASTDNIRIIKNTGILYVRMLILMFLGLYTSRIVLNALGVSDYGIYNVVGGIVAAFSILTTAMSGTTQRYITIALGKNDIENLKDTFSVSFTIHTLISIILLIIIEIFGLYFLYYHAVIPIERFPAALWVFQISTITAILTVINVPFYGTIIAHEKMSAFAFFSIIDVIIKLLICFILPYTNHDKLITYSLLLFISSAINFTCMQGYCFKNFVEVRFRYSWNKNMLKSMFNMTSWYLIDKAAYMSFNQGIVLITNIFFGPAVNAALGIATQGSNIIRQFLNNFQVAVNPQITKSYANGDLENMHNLIMRSAKFSCFLLLYLIIPTFFEAKLLLTLWLKNIPDHTILYFRLSLLIIVLYAITNTLDTSNLAYGKIRKYLLYTNIIRLLILPTVFLLYKIGSIPEVSSIVHFLFFLILIFVSSKILESQIKLRLILMIKNVYLPVLKVYFLSGVLSYIVYLIFYDFHYLRLLILILFSIIINSILIFQWGLNKAERQYIKKTITNFRKKFT